MIFLDIPDMQTVIPLGSIVVLSGLIYTWQKIAREARKSRKEDSAAILQQAKEEDALMKSKLEARIEKIDLQLASLELNVNKDITHLKDTYNSEIRNLGKKIEDLRDEVRATHGQLVQLLTTLIDNKKD
jgi:CII-binding regulator of phage lambda lysogenization HflD